VLKEKSNPITQEQSLNIKNMLATLKQARDNQV
jgi:hypothetical protein